MHTFSEFRFYVSSLSLFLSSCIVSELHENMNHTRTQVTSVDEFERKTKTWILQSNFMEMDSQRFRGTEKLQLLPFLLFLFIFRRNIEIKSHQTYRTNATILYQQNQFSNTTICNGTKQLGKLDSNLIYFSCAISLRNRFVLTNFLQMLRLIQQTK